MELKFSVATRSAYFFALLIEPYGIEMLWHHDDLLAEDFLLIEPYGIEMAMKFKEALAPINF